MVIQVTGTRQCSDYKIVDKYINLSLEEFGYTLDDVELLVHGDCRGIDKTCEQWADSNWIKSKSMPAEWHIYGKGAGPKRNQEMLDFCLDNFEFHDILGIGFYIDGGVGTQDMMRRMSLAGIKTNFWKLKQT